MKNNKIIIYIGLLLVGMLLGWLLFGGSSKEETTHNHNTDVENSQVWTCSMHPQIRQDEAGDCPICGMELIPANSMETAIDPDAIRMGKTARALAKVETMTVGNAESFTANKSFSGQLAINQDRVESISANYNARVEKLYINDIGERVLKGQVIAELYAPDVQILKDEYDLASKQGNTTLLKSITKKIENFELTIKDINATQNGILKLRSQKTGVVAELNINQGDNIKADQILMQIADLSNLWANLDIYENDLNNLNIGDKLNIKIPNQQDVIGEVTFISPVLDGNTRSAKARVVIDNKNLDLKPGVFISAELENKPDGISQKQTLMIPKSAVLWTGERSVVYQQFEDKTGVYYKMKIVNTGKSAHDAIEIISGISSGDVIVTHGAFSIDSEAQLADKPSMMNQNLSISIDPKSDIQLDNKYLKYYFDLKNALVNDDFQLAKSISKDYFTTLSNDKSDKVNYSPLNAALSDINDKDNVEDFRKAFINLSDEIIRLSKSLNTEQKMYVQYCPMADSYDGAYWLSLDKSIRNPYFGASMLKCGEVKEVIGPL